MKGTLRSVLSACALAVLGMTGCATSHSDATSESTWGYPQAHSATLSETPEEHNARVSRVLNRDRRALTEDLDILFMTDRPTRLSRWHDR